MQVEKQKEGMIDIKQQLRQEKLKKLNSFKICAQREGNQKTEYFIFGKDRDSNEILKNKSV